MIRNNVTRLLDSRSITYQAFDLQTGDKLGAEETAARLGVPPDSVYKTIVVTRLKGKPILCLVSASAEVNLKKLSSSLGEKKLHLPTQREAEQLTGLQAGGISPLAVLNKGFQVCIDLPARQLSELYISGGQRGLSIRLAVNDLVALTGAQWVEAR